MSKDDDKGFGKKPFDDWVQTEKEAFKPKLIKGGKQDRDDRKGKK